MGLSRLNRWSELLIFTFSILLFSQITNKSVSIPLDSKFRQPPIAKQTPIPTELSHRRQYLIVYTETSYQWLLLRWSDSANWLMPMLRYCWPRPTSLTEMYWLAIAQPAATTATPASGPIPPAWCTCGRATWIHLFNNYKGKGQQDTMVMVVIIQLQFQMVELFFQHQLQIH